MEMLADGIEVVTANVKLELRSVEVTLLSAVVVFTAAVSRVGREAVGLIVGVLEVVSWLLLDVEIFEKVDVELLYDAVV